jgi:PqqD family protein of HPr-rel-A system
MANLQQSTGSRWAAYSSQLLWRTWEDDEAVVYHIPSGDTHLLNLVAAEALRALEQGPLDCPELAERIAPSLACVPDDDFLHHLEKLMAEFGELGLIEPVL